MSHTITFDPRATPEQYACVREWFGGRCGLAHWDNGYLSCSSNSVPCDLTLDPTKPETWARAVYEAGQDSVKVDAMLKALRRSGFFDGMATPPVFVNGVEYRPVTPPTAPPRCH